MNFSHYYIACPGVLSIATNVHDFTWSYGTAAPQATRSEFEDCVVRMRLEVVDQVEIPAADQLGKYHYWSGNRDEDTLYYDRPLALGKRLQIAVKNLTNGEPSLTVNRDYYRYISHRFMNLHSIGYILTDLASLLLLRHGFAPIHCSAFRFADATVVVAAPPNTGKTLTTMLACLDHSADFIAEDLAITDGRTVHSVPWTSTFRYYNQVDGTFAARVRNRATRLLPVLDLFASSKPKSITHYISQDHLAFQSQVTHVVMLERGSACVGDASVDEAYTRVRNLNRYEFNYHKAPISVAYEYFNPQLNLDAAVRAEESILRQLVEHADCRWIVQSPDATKYAGMILDGINSVNAAVGLSCDVA